MSQLLPMSQKELNYYEVIKRLIRREINVSKGAELLKLTTRHVRRLKNKVKRYGAKALIHGSRGKEGNRKLPGTEVKRIKELLHKHYADFGPTFASEKLALRHRIVHDPKTIRQIMIDEGLWKSKSRKQPKHHSWRQRRDSYGELQQFDGSYEYWFEDRAPHCCLLAAIDDATGKITRAEFAPHEGVVPVFAFWQGYLLSHGRPQAIYLDKFSTYKMNPAMAKDNHELKTQFERAMQELGIEPITAHSPEAKGRIERLFGTLQDRLVKELRLKGISDMTVANLYLEKEFIPAFNEQFSVEPRLSANLHRSLAAVEKQRLPAIFARHAYRTVRNDFTLSFNSQWYQLAENQPALVRPKDKVMVEYRLDDSVHLRLRDKYLNYQILPQRPPQKTRRPWALTNSSPKPIHKPALDHPWRKAAQLTTIIKQHGN